ncbi:MAG: type II toxin-antitoxin system VapC family toxin [Pyrinomonadaceae bacterium]
MSEVYYADSSALLKRHVIEIGSNWIKNEFSVGSNNTVYTSKLSIAEVLSALNRRKRESSVSPADYAKFSRDFLAVSKFQYETIDLSDAVLLESQRLLENYPLRVGDAIQLAYALREISRRGLDAKD